MLTAEYADFDNDHGVCMIINDCDEWCIDFDMLAMLISIDYFQPIRIFFALFHDLTCLVLQCSVAFTSHFTYSSHFEVLKNILAVLTTLLIKAKSSSAPPSFWLNFDVKFNVLLRHTCVS